MLFTQASRCLLVILILCLPTWLYAFPLPPHAEDGEQNREPPKAGDTEGGITAIAKDHKLLKRDSALFCQDPTMKAEIVLEWNAIVKVLDGALYYLDVILKLYEIKEQDPSRNFKAEKEDPLKWTLQEWQAIVAFESFLGKFHWPQTDGDAGVKNIEGYNRVLAVQRPLRRWRSYLMDQGLPTIVRLYCDDSAINWFDPETKKKWPWRKVFSKEHYISFISYTDIMSLL